MDVEKIQALLRTRHNLRVGPHTAAYVAAKLAAGKAPKSIKVLAADARTGVPLPQAIDPAALAGDAGQMGLFQT